MSSIEPRKNHRLLLDVWRSLVALHGAAAPLLLCVGRPVMKGQELIDAVEHDPVLGEYVHFISGLADEDLDWCYRNAAFTVYPSLYEGWGLPIAESLHYGKACIASDTSSMREVAPHLTDLLDPGDPAAWQERISFYLGDPSHLAEREALIRRTYEPHSWQAAGAEVLTALAGLTPSWPPAAYVDPFTRLSAGRAEDYVRAGPIFAEGWATPARPGRALLSDRGTLAFTYLGTASYAVRLRFAGKPARREPGVDMATGTAETSFDRASNALDVVIHRPGAWDETRLRLVAGQGAVVAGMDFADTPEDLAELNPRPKDNSWRRLAKRLLSRLLR